MRILLALAALLLAVSGCGDETVTAADPGGDQSPAGMPIPTEAPVPDGPVRTRDLATVMDKGTPELCVGPIAESYPPQCGGPEIVGWDWSEHGQDVFEQQGEVRWGTFLVTGRWDGTSFEVTDTIPGPLYDPAIPEPPAQPRPSASYSQQELAGIAAELGPNLPGASGAYAADGHVLVDVLFDDGTLQQWADDAFGEDVVLVSSLLVPVD